MRKCNHCQNSFADDALQMCVIKEERLYFCCEGCKNVYCILKDYHLDDFYQKLNHQTLIPPKPSQTSLQSYDSDFFAKKYIQTTPNQKNKITILIHDIHCSACIWLNEHMLYKLNGVLEAQINYTTHQATIIWDPQLISLSQIIQTIQNLGYGVSVGEQMQHNALQKERLFFIKLIVAIFCTMNIMWIAIAQYSGYFQGIDKEYSLLLNIASLILCTPVLLFSGSVFYISAFKGLKMGRVGMDLLVFSGSCLTYFYSIYALIVGDETYFESVCMILTFVLLGKFLENKARKSAGETLQNLSTQIPQSLKVGTQMLSPQEVPIGSVIEVFAGEKIIIDGVLQSPIALLDESSLSGESTPISKHKGDSIYSGTFALTYNFTYQTTHTFEQSTLNTLIELVQKAQNSKPQIQKIANAISSRFSQTILLIATFTFLFYLYQKTPFDEALKIAVSVIIIACPCALALATPIANIVGLSKAYTEGILFKQGAYLETLAKVSTFCFDKTGTLTLGCPQVIKEIKFCDYDPLLLTSFLQQTPHPIAKGILSSLPSHPPQLISDFETFNAQGIKAQSSQGELIGGNLEFLQSQHITIPPFTPHTGSIFAFAIKGKIQSLFFLQDTLKPYAKDLITFLHSQKIETLILSGDEESEVQRIANELQISHYYAKLSPQSKTSFIQSLQRQGKKVAMFGDGINDSLALKGSEIGITTSQKSDLALQNSDIVLLQDNLAKLAQALMIAKKTFQTIKANIIFSLFYNSFTIPLAILGYISPIFASISMSLSSLVVIFYSLGIKSFKDTIIAPLHQGEQ